MNKPHEVSIHGKDEFGHLPEQSHVPASADAHTQDSDLAVGLLERAREFLDMNPCPVHLSARDHCAIVATTFAAQETTALQTRLAAEVERREMAVALVREVMVWHRDPQNGGYNECDTDPCAWCGEAAEVVGVISDMTTGHTGLITSQENNQDEG